MRLSIDMAISKIKLPSYVTYLIPVHEKIKIAGVRPTLLNTGDVLQSRYRILHPLKSTGYSRTYLAEDLDRFNELRVLKEFASQLKETNLLEQAQKLFEREAGVLYRLEHPQIPKFWELFCFEKQGESHLFLVWDYVEGQVYRATGDRRIETNQKFSEVKIKQLLRDVLPILEYIHSMGVIHRNISPDNAVLRSEDRQTVLIDFGCIEEIETKIQFELNNTPIPSIASVTGKTGYAPPEQIERGIVYPHCDLYALAATAVVLLTGKEPQQLIDPDNYRWNWRSQVTVSPKLEWILTTMLSPNPSDRFGSAAEVSKIIQDISIVETTPVATTKPKKSFNYMADKIKVGKIEMPLWGRLRGIQAQAADTDSANSPLSTRNIFEWGEHLLMTRRKFVLTSAKSRFFVPLAAMFILGGYLCLKIANLKVANTDSVRADTQLRNRFSQGERLLIKQTANPTKEIAVDAMARGKYSQAVALFDASRKTVSNDPETLIYLNNARIGKAKAYSIAVTVPIGSNVSAAQEILRGVAQAQNRINQTGGINNFPLKVQIVNDDNDRAIAKTIAKNLGQNPNILGVVGHYASDVTWATAPIYEAKKLVAISPINTSVKLSNLSPYIFRTIPSGFLAARGLAEYMLQNLQQKKVVVFSNSQSNYSKSLESEFTAAVRLGGGEVVNTFDLADANFNAGDCLNKAIANGAEAIMLAADTETLDKALQVIQVNSKQLSLLGGDAIYNRETLQIAGEEGENMVLTIPWHIQNTPSNEFVRTANKLWGGKVSWRSAMAYDAVQALIAAIALDDDPTRTSIQKNLSDFDFSTIGASDRINLLASGDRSDKIHLVKIQQGNNELGYEFVPIGNE